MKTDVLWKNSDNHEDEMTKKERLLVIERDNFTRIRQRLIRLE